MNPRRAGAALALAAVVVLAAAELTTVFEVTVGSLNVAKRSATGGENHGYALLVIGGVALAMALLALRGGGRAPGVALVALGAAALAIAVLIDLPDTSASGQLPEALAYENAQAHAGTGLALELAGGGLLVAAGVLLALGAGGGGGGGVPDARGSTRRARAGATVEPPRSGDADAGNGGIEGG